MDSLNYKPIPEYKKHKAIILVWPDTPMVWGKKIIEVQSDYIKLIDIILEYEDVFLIVKHGQENTVRAKVNARVSIINSNYNRIWIRDSAPIWAISVSGELVGIDFLYEDYYKGKQLSYDNQLGHAVCEAFGIRRIEAPFELEGGNIISNDRSIYTNVGAISYKDKQCAEIQLQIERYFGIAVNVLDVKVIGDNTAHIDNILRFADDKTVIVYGTDGIDIAIDKMELIIHRIHHPDVLFRLHDNIINIKNYPTINQKFLKRIAYSYINAIELNSAVIVPQFGLVEADNDALSVYELAYRHKKVIPFNVQNIILGGGGLHCITKEIPWYNQ
jgi:agmatine deiminase